MERELTIEDILEELNRQGIDPVELSSGRTIVAGVYFNVSAGTPVVAFGFGGELTGFVGFEFTDGVRGRFVNAQYAGAVGSAGVASLVTAGLGAFVLSGPASSFGGASGALTLDAFASGSVGFGIDDNGPVSLATFGGVYGSLGASVNLGYTFRVSADDGYTYFLGSETFPSVNSLTQFYQQILSSPDGVRFTSDNFTLEQQISGSDFILVTEVSTFSGEGFALAIGAPLAGAFMSMNGNPERLFVQSYIVDANGERAKGDSIAQSILRGIGEPDKNGTVHQNIGRDALGDLIELIAVENRSGYIRDTSPNRTPFPPDFTPIPPNFTPWPSDDEAFSPLTAAQQLLGEDVFLSDAVRGGLADIFNNLQAMIPEGALHTVRATITSENRLVLTYYDPEENNGGPGSDVVSRSIRSDVLEPVFVNLLQGFEIGHVTILSQGEIRQRITIGDITHDIILQPADGGELPPFTTFDPAPGTSGGPDGSDGPIVIFDDPGALVPGATITERPDGTQIETFRERVATSTIPGYQGDEEFITIITETVITSPDGAETVIGYTYDPETNLQIAGRPTIRISEEALERLREDAINIEQFNALYGRIGRTIGSSLGRLLTDQIDGAAGVIADTAASAVFGQIGAAFGAALGEGGNFVEAFGGNLQTAFSSAQLGSALQGASIGTVSSLLTAELGNVLGLDGVAGEVFGVVGNSVVGSVLAGGPGSILQNANAIFDGVSDFVFNQNLSVFQGANTDTAGALANLPGAIASFVGSRLGSAVVSAQTQAGALLGSIGSSVGAIIGSTIPIPFVGTAIGSFVGQVLGTLIGNLFGRRRPRIPMADASTVLNFTDGQYQLGTVNSVNSGNEDLVTDLANAAADTLNGFIDVISAGGANARNVNTTSPTQVYGHEGNQLYVTLAGRRHNVDSADEAVERGALYAIERTQIAGGGLFLKRAVLASTSDNFAGFGGDLQIAGDYTTYIQNQGAIDAAIAAPYESLSDEDKAFYDANVARFSAVQQRDQQDLSGSNLTWYNQNRARVDSITETLNSISTFAAGWIITLQRAAELGLNESAASDFYGGAKGFVDSLQSIVDAPLDYEDVVLFLRGNDLEIYRDTDGNGRPHGGIDTLVFDETNFLSPIGSDGGGVGYNQATSNDNLTVGNDIILNVSGTIDDLTAQAVTRFIDIPGEFGGGRTPYTAIETLEGGDDIITGNTGANTFYGRSGDDWLDGGGGTGVDRLYGGDGNDVLIGRGGNDALYGQDGDDVIIGGDGNDWIRGGAGDDILIQGAGTSTVNGEAGDDTLILTQGALGAYIGHYRGGYSTQDNGNDTISLENFNQGIRLNMAYRPGSWDTHSNTFYRHEAVRLYDIRSNDGSNVRLNFAYIAQIDNVTGTAFADEITGDAGNNIIRGGGGDDVIFATAGQDVYEGGAGADTFHQNSPWNASAIISYEHSQGGVDVSLHYIDALGGGHAFGGDASGDTFVGGFFHLTGSGLADVLEGNHGNNNLSGLDGDDYFIATRGVDTVRGGEGFDTVDFGNHTGSSGLTINAFDNGTTGGYLNGIHGTHGATRVFDIEHVVGTSGADTIRFRDGDNVLEGGAGNDRLYGGVGNDTYFVELDGGTDLIYEFGNEGHDTILVGFEDGLSWDDIFIGTPPSGAGAANFEVSAQGQLLARAFNSASPNREDVGVDALDVGGSGAIDIWYITGGSFTDPAGRATNDVLRGYGDARGYSILQGGDGNDTIYSASNSSGSNTYETNDNILHGGRGNDTIFASVGDDQYIFDRGSGRDTVRDTGGLDHIQFGPGVAASDLLFEVIGNDLFIGVAPDGTGDTSDLRASRADDYIRVSNAVQHITGRLGRTTSTFSANLIEFITVENANIDIRTLDIDLGGTSTSPTSDPTPTPDPSPTPDPEPTFPDPGDFPTCGNFFCANEGSNPGFVLPVAFDLDGDGLELISIDESRIVIRGENRELTRIGWLGSDDGFLALDRNEDGRIDQLNEISFVDDFEGATTDLEGLRGFDSNEDGVFDAQDARFHEFRIWRDLNQNGRGRGRELQTLEEAGITSISLELQSTGRDLANFADSVATNTADFTRTDGSTGTTYDVALASTVIREGRESSYSEIQAYTGAVTDRLGRISTRRLERLLARQERQAANSSTTVTPIVLDLDGDGALDLTHLSESGVETDVNNDGTLDQIGWVGARDGLLGLDRNGDGTITAVEEISFVEDLPGAQTDLEGLAAFDTDGNGLLDGGDERFADFRVWQDVNQDGISQVDELRTLEEAGLLSINLTSHTGRITSNEDDYLDNVVFGHTEVLWSDGRSAIAGDVGLRAQYTGVFADNGEDNAPRYITGFAGLENVTYGAAERFEQIVTQSAWGRVVGRRSGLMKRLLAAEAEQARLDSLGNDLGVSQDELLAEFEAGYDDEGEDINVSQGAGGGKVQDFNRSVAGVSSVANIETYEDKLSALNDIQSGSVVSNVVAALNVPVSSKVKGLGAIMPALSDTAFEAADGLNLPLDFGLDFGRHIGREDGVGDIITRLEYEHYLTRLPFDGANVSDFTANSQRSSRDLNENVGSVNNLEYYEDKLAALRGVAGPLTLAGADHSAGPQDNGLTLDDQVAATLDQLTQAMAGFGGQSAFEGLNVRSSAQNGAQDILGQGSTNLLQRRPVSVLA